MIVTKSWLSEYLDIKDYSDKELYDIFTSHINEVETMKTLKISWEDIPKKKFDF
jgi:hypothetical protein